MEARKARSKSPRSKSRVPLAPILSEPVASAPSPKEPLVPEETPIPPPTMGEAKQAMIHEMVDDVMMHVNRPQSESIADVQAEAQRLVNSASNLRRSSSSLPSFSSEPSKFAGIAPSTKPLSPEAEKHGSLCSLYRGFRKQYSGTITWNFKSDNDLMRMPTSEVERELSVVRFLVNSQASTGVFEAIITVIAEAVEKTALKYPSAWTMLAKYTDDSMSFTEAIQTQLAAGHFKPEIDQLQVEYAGWFTQGPEIRLVRKIVQTGYQVNKDNIIAIQHSGKSAKEKFNL